MARQLAPQRAPPALLPAEHSIPPSRSEPTPEGVRTSDPVAQSKDLSRKHPAARADPPRFAQDPRYFDAESVPRTIRRRDIQTKTSAHAGARVLDNQARR